ncbi:MAG: T9SS type B sorting domain-containing protein [Bacteroidia bacterium]
MCHKLGFLGGLLWAQCLTSYQLSFSQKIVLRSSTAGPDSVEWVIKFVAQGSQQDRLASANFPFYFNAFFIDTAGMKIVWARKWGGLTGNSYYNPIKLAKSWGRASVNVSRKFGYTGTPDILINGDTLAIIKAPLKTCGTNLFSEIVWDSLPAAILVAGPGNSLVNLKPCFTWGNVTFLRLVRPVCDPNVTWVAGSQDTICIGDSVGFDLAFQQCSDIRPHIFLLYLLYRVAPSPMLVASYVRYPGNHYFPMFVPPGSYFFVIQGVDTVCGGFSRPDTKRVVVDRLSLIERGFLRAPTPICKGDTTEPLPAFGPGVWLTRNGNGAFLDVNDPQTRYASSPNEPDSVILCWVIRPQDLSRCRERSMDTICKVLILNVSDADGQIVAPNPLPDVCAGELSPPLKGQISSGSIGVWTSSGSGEFLPSESDSVVRYLPGPSDPGTTVELYWNVFGNACGISTDTVRLYVRSGSTVQVDGGTRVCQRSVSSWVLQGASGCDSILWFKTTPHELLNSSQPLDANHPAFYSYGLSLDLPTEQEDSLCFTAVCFSGDCKAHAYQCVKILPSPKAGFTATPLFTNMNNPTITFVNTSTGATSFVWNFGNPIGPSVDSSQNPVYTYSAPGVYTVALYATNELGCSDFYLASDLIRIVERQVFFPNAFSPNGDGKNDVFRPLPLELGLRMEVLEVFDTWGQKVYEGKGILAWEGKSSDGSALEPGVYTYRTIVNLQNEGPKTYTGLVHITP